MILFGWTGAKHRHVEVHKDVWTRLGFEGTFFSFSPHDIFYLSALKSECPKFSR